MSSSTATPAGAVALKRKFFKIDARQFAGTALDGALDIVLRHVFRLGRENRSAQARIGIRIAPAVIGGNADFLNKAGKNLAALGVECALFVLDCRPF